jgi:ABC-type dipeptide/oligopeptide/nickel transport system ATPase component
MSIFIDYLKKRLSQVQKKNCLILIIGETGSGKSYAGLKLCEQFDKGFSVNKVAFKSREFMDIIDNKELSYKKAAILFDEIGIAMSSRQWQNLTHQMVNAVLETFRFRNLLVVFTVPDISFVDVQTRKMFHFRFDMKGIDFKRKVSKVKPLYIQYNASVGKSYHKYLRIINKDGQRQKLKTISFPLPSKQLRDAYERKKKKFSDNLNKRIRQAMDMNKSKGINDRKVLLCQVCGYKWMSRSSQLPRVCSKCGTERWNKKIF